MYKIRLLPLAIEDLQNISQNLADYSTQSAVKFLDRFLEVTDILSDKPGIYAFSADLPDYRRVNIDKYYCLFFQSDEAEKAVFVFRLLSQRADHKQHHMK